MGGIFDMDGPFYKIGGLIFDLFFLNLLWIIFSIPIVTVGASTTALFYVCGKRVNGEDGYLFRDFWKSFKMNFKQSTLIWLALMLISIVLIVDFKTLPVMGQMGRYFSILLFVIGFEGSMVAIYVFPVLSKFYIKTLNAFKTAFVMANRHILTTLCCIFVIVADIFIFFKFSFFLFFMMSSYAYATSFLFKRVFDKYLPKDDEEQTDNSI